MRRPRRITLRARLTLIYGGLFLAGGVVLLGVTYALFNSQVGRGTIRLLTRVGPDPRTDTVITTNELNDVITNSEAERVAREQAALLREAAAHSLLVQGTIALVVVGALAIGFGWLVAGRVLAPLHGVTGSARRIAASADPRQHRQITLRGPDDEVKDLAEAFNTMVERLDRSFDGQRRFVANASHELRTPLTLNRSLVEVAMHRRSASPDVKELGEKLLQINSRHERLISGLLVLAKSENVVERFPLDLANVVTHVVAQTADQARAADVTVTDSPAEAPTLGDALLLERLVHNLVENGIRHNEPGGWVHVGTRTRGDVVEIEVSNTGPAVADAEVPALFEPFRRRAAPRLDSAKGAGLGLSIVRSVASAHDGEVAARPRDGGGLVVTVRLPARVSVQDRTSFGMSRRPASGR
ncbi:sensor histidine kinase [Amycolatopsis thermoflava]|uniref:sensor histidine kinase n=1 Tax=Amycolatopsis thermoflava TaxID=84480 RepID=UPI0005639D42|nr:HAMP domain-containing sensor histidine kinase [Amycolatopsis thermoflava]